MEQENKETTNEHKQKLTPKQESQELDEHKTIRELGQRVLDRNKPQEIKELDKSGEYILQLEKVGSELLIVTQKNSKSSVKFSATMKNYATTLKDKIKLQ